MHNDQHNPNRPLQFWFQESNEGVVLFIVFYTQACRYGRCVGCNLYLQQCSHPVSRSCLLNQIDSVLHDTKVLERASEVRKVIISNNGSILDECTFSSTALTYFMFLLSHHLPHTKVLSIETRPEYADIKELEFLNHLRQETFIENIELAIGVEAWSDHLRNDVFGKGISLTTVDQFIQRTAAYKFGIKCYFMFKPVVGITEDEAVADIVCAIRWLDTMAKMHQAKINMHLNPTYVARGTKLEKQFLAGEYEPPYLKNVARAIRCGVDTDITIFVGLFDEGLAVEGGSFIREGDEGIVRVLRDFNRTQDFDLLCDDSYIQMLGRGHRPAMQRS